MLLSKSPCNLQRKSSGPKEAVGRGVSKREKAQPTICVRKKPLVEKKRAGGLWPDGGGGGGSVSRTKNEKNEVKPTGENPRARAYTPHENQQWKGREKDISKVLTKIPLLSFKGYRKKENGLNKEGWERNMLAVLKGPYSKVRWQRRSRERSTFTTFDSRLWKGG